MPYRTPYRLEPSGVDIQPPPCSQQLVEFPNLLVLHCQTNLSSPSKVVYYRCLPLGEVTADDVIAGVSYKPEVERQVVNARYLHS